MTVQEPSPRSHGDAAVTLGDFVPPVPPESTLAMPLQSLRRWSGPRPSLVDRPPTAGTRLTRLFVFGGALALAAFGIGEMVGVVRAGGIVGLEWPLIVLFGLTFSWIALSCTSGIAGFIAGFAEHRVARPAPRPLASRTALVMPVYNENPARTFGALQAMAEAVIAEGAGQHFEIFVLSDTTDPTAWIEEEVAFIAPAPPARPAACAVWYRRRSENTARKAGNVADFVTRWGGRYDHMLVLDADSLMSRRHARDAGAADGGRSEAPASSRRCRVIVNRKTLFARLQQFAGRVYGPIIARGLAVWHGRDGNYWGHNAIIRTRAFAEPRGLARAARPQAVRRRMS